MHVKKIFSILIFFLFLANYSCAQDYETCSFSGDEAWAGDTAAITAFLKSCGRIDTTNYDDEGKKTTKKPHHQTITLRLNSGKVLHTDSIYFLAETMPAFPGGDAEMIKYISNNIKYPAAARANKTDGRVYASFIIERDGSVNKIKITRGIGNGCDEETVRVLNTMPKWTPGKVKGKPVRVELYLPVKFAPGG